MRSASLLLCGTGVAAAASLACAHTTNASETGADAGWNADVAALPHPALTQVPELDRLGRHPPDAPSRPSWSPDSQDEEDIFTEIALQWALPSPRERICVAHHVVEVAHSEIHPDAKVITQFVDELTPEFLSRLNATLADAGRGAELVPFRTCRPGPRGWEVDGGPAIPISIGDIEVDGAHAVAHDETEEVPQPATLTCHFVRTLALERTDGGWTSRVTGYETADYATLRRR